MLDAHPLDLSCASEVGAEFEWTIKAVQGVQFVATMNLAAVLFHRQALAADSWMEALSQLRSMLPATPLIVCHGFSDSIDWPQLCEAGAFHHLHLPLIANEVRQSFGFVWQATKRINTASPSGHEAGLAIHRATPELNPARAGSL